ncbi:DUF3299 domain-containing protein [uncultured Roseobacter sp.]|uniref:DUF3299 domain-containing protein n=1 Tax=uncultured Roseobacter sp. TaxID=114847 RepID=UPI0026257562|nr:DUF3299 domain-containing protein [uncultured Roseobacter sp.]
MTVLTRRSLITSSLASAALPSTAFAAAPRDVAWDDLIPPGVPYAEIIGEGAIDFINDTWNPIYDANATKLNQTLDGAYIRMPGYIIPMELGAEGVTEFLLVPYVGACIHVPPPPPNQLVFVVTETPWPSNQLWDAVWVTGTMRTQMKSTDIADTGYALAAVEVEPFDW